MQSSLCKVSQATNNNESPHFYVAVLFKYKGPFPLSLRVALRG